MKNYLFTFLFVITYSYANIDYNVNYLMKFSDGDNISTDIFENYFDISLYYEDFYFYSLLKYGKPLIGINPNSLHEVNRINYLEYSGDDIEISLGNIYTLYGRGLSFHSYEDRNIDYDNGVEGIHLIYISDKQFEIYGTLGEKDFSARSNPADLEANINIDNKLSSFGFLLYREYFDIYYSMHIYNQIIDSTTIVEMSSFGTYLGDYLTNTLKISNEHTFAEYEMKNIEHNLGTNLYFDNVELSFEYSHVFYNKIHGERVEGYRGYFSTYFNIFDIGVLYEYKDYNTPYLYSVFSNPPTVFKEASSPLISRHLHTIDFNNELGHHIVINKTFSEQLNLNINYAFAYKHTLHEGASKPSIIDIFSNMLKFENLDEFSTILPYKQFYFELNGWSNNGKLYYKFGFDIYDEYINTDSPSTVEEDSLNFLTPNKILNAYTIPTKFSYILKNGNSLSAYLEFQELKSELTGDITQSVYLNPSFNYQGKIIFSLFCDFEKTEYENNNWVGLDLTYYL